MKAQNFLQLESESEAWEGFNLPLLKGGPHRKHKKECGQPQLTASKELGTSVLQPKGTKSVSNLNELGSRFLPFSDKEHSPVDILIFGLAEILSREPIYLSSPDFWPIKIKTINLYCFVFVVICYGNNRKLIERVCWFYLRIFGGLFSREQSQQKLLCKGIWSWKTLQNNGVE